VSDDGLELCERASGTNVSFMPSEKCRASFWRAERSALPESLSNEHAAALKDQQARRAPCICDANGSAKDEYDFQVSIPDRIPKH
jgi:hypothetical protein